MKFGLKINQLLAGGTLGLVVALGYLPTITWSESVAIAQIAQGLAPEAVNLRAKQIVVRIDGASVGSGTLIESTDDVYTVLTNWHVVKNQGKYVVSTIDGRKHQVDPASVKQLPGLDLAVLQFASNQNYQVAELGDSASLSEGQNVYFAGYPGELRQEDNRYYRFFAANLVGILPKATENGYSLVYNGEAFPGMSGGPVFNRDGLVIGVHGEANIHALSGGTSNYGIPINSYQTAVANLNQQPTSPPPANNNNDNTANNDAGDNVATKPQTAPPPKPQPTPETKPASNNSPQEATNPNPNVSSVPTFVPNPQPTKPEKPDNPPKKANNDNETEATEEPVAVEETTNTNTNNTDNQPPASSPQPEVEVPLETIEVNTVTTTKQIALVSPKTGMNYTALRDLLKEEKWSEADIETYKLVEQLVKTAKQRNKHLFIELKTIAEFSCPDIRTIDALWMKYTGNKFGFSPQQEVWQSVNQQGDFSTQTWRLFATEVGWKQGAVDSGSGYLLYDQLKFNPEQAPVGHLPWWFSLPDEEQKVIKHLFARCNFNPTPQELAAEEGKNQPQKPRNNNNNDNNNSQPQS